MFADICTGLISILTPETIGAVALGIFTGLMFGAIPGISGIMAISILLPLTFYVSPLVGIPMLLGIYKASMFGGSITAVLLNTPGAPPAVCTAMDGYPLTKQGKAGKGLNAALVGSVFGDTFSNILLICVAAPQMCIRDRHPLFGQAPLPPVRHPNPVGAHRSGRIAFPQASLGVSLVPGPGLSLIHI